MLCQKKINSERLKKSYSFSKISENKEEIRSILKFVQNPSLGLQPSSHTTRNVCVTSYTRVDTEAILRSFLVRFHLISAINRKCQGPFCSQSFLNGLKLLIINV